MKLDRGKTVDRRNATYRIYLQLHSSRSLYPNKTIRSVMSELMYAEPEAWRAFGITRAALSAYHVAGHRYIKGIQRAHLTDRKEMVQYIIERDQPLSYIALFEYWLKTDRVVIALTRENQPNKLGEWIPFENQEAKYFQRLGIGFQYRPVIEGELTRRLTTNVT